MRETKSKLIQCSSADLLVVVDCCVEEGINSEVGGAWSSDSIECDERGSEREERDAKQRE